MFLDEPHVRINIGFDQTDHIGNIRAPRQTTDRCIGNIGVVAKGEVV